MNNSPDKSTSIPYRNVVAGIHHGPYPAAPPDMVDLYMQRYMVQSEPKVNEEQKRADIESEWQYDQHSAAVMEAYEDDRINHVHAYYMLEKVLRPWFIGHRNPGE